MHKFHGFVPVDDPSTVGIEALSSFHLSTPLALLFPEPGADPEPIPAAWAAGVCSSQQIRASSLPGSSGFVENPGTENLSKAELPIPAKAQRVSGGWSVPLEVFSLPVLRGGASQGWSRIFGF